MQIYPKIYPLSGRELRVYQRKKEKAPKPGIFMQNDVQEKGCDSLYSNTPLKPTIPPRTYVRKRFKRKIVSESVEKVPEELPINVFAIKDKSFGDLGLLPDFNVVLQDSKESSGFGEVNNVDGESTG